MLMRYILPGVANGAGREGRHGLKWASAVLRGRTESNLALRLWGPQPANM